MVDKTELERAYDRVKSDCQKGWRSHAAGIAVGRLAELALRFLSEEARLVALRSAVAGKDYISFKRNGVVARPANRKLFVRDPKEVGECWRSWLPECPTFTCRSTRERIVQAWSHQRILDTAFGAGSYRGVMVVFSETKLDSKSLNVVEICVSNQWLVYQTFLARMHCIYYFDMPRPYLELTNAHPETIRIRPISDLLAEIAGLAAD